MCLAIAPSSQCSNSLFARTWRRISATPLRLFSFCAGIHIAVCSILAVYSSIMNMPLTVNALINVFLYGIIALVVYGYMMTSLPEKYAFLPVHYARYSSIYLLIFISLLMLETGALISNELVTAGMALLVPGWIIALQGMKNMHGWLASRSQPASRIILFLLSLILACLLLSIVVSISGNYQYLLKIIATVNVVSWLMILLVFKKLLSKAPANTRVITI